MLNTILDKLQWTPYGIECGSPELAKVVHKFLREAVLDRHIFVTKVVGFTITSNSKTDVVTGNYIARHSQIGESYPEIMVNLLDKLFLDVNDDYSDMLLMTGMNTCENNSFGDLRDFKAQMLYLNPAICRCLTGNTILRVRLTYDCGYKSMAENSKLLTNEFFPCYTDYSISEFVRVLPMVQPSSLVPIRYYNGMTIDIFKNILAKWNIYLMSNNVKSEEKTWVSHFVH